MNSLERLIDEHIKFGMNRGKSKEEAFRITRNMIVKQYNKTKKIVVSVEDSRTGETVKEEYSLSEVKKAVAKFEEGGN